MITFIFVSVFYCKISI